jgi:hypothetical protein
MTHLDPIIQHPDEPVPKFSRLDATLLEDKKRVRVKTVLEGPSSRPDLELILEDDQGNELARSLVLGILFNTAELTLHIREANSIPPYKLTAVLMDGQEHVLDTVSLTIT